MTLPAPNLDDRRFQDLVDEAKRLVQQRCPEWTDHNVSDPGVTLIETFAWMVDQLVYRLNRVPDRNYVKFLELIGVGLFPPNAASADVTFWLSAPQPEVLTVSRGTQVATRRNNGTEPVVFATTDELRVIPCALQSILTSGTNGFDDHTATLAKGADFFCFEPSPLADNALYVGLTDPVPSCAVALRFKADIEGVGVDPTNPPLRWEAWDGDGWSRCDVDRDETGGLNRAGDVVLHVPPTHEASIVERQRAGWLRARVLAPDDEQPRYSASPKITSLAAMTIGGTVGAVNAEEVHDELLGFAEGVPGQRFTVARRPMVRGPQPWALEIGGDEGWQRWEPVDDFASSGEDDRHFVVDPVAGEVRLGPAVRLPEGALHQYGAVPKKGSAVRIVSYLTGGGAQGNVTRGSLTILRSSLPFVSTVTNRRPAQGGRDAEDVENAKARGPVALRSRGRAVTVEDFEHLACQAALDIARVRAVPAGDGSEPGAVRVLVVPHAPSDRGRLRFGQLVPPDAVLARVATVLDERRLIGTRVVVEPPEYVGVTVVAQLRSRPNASPSALKEAALDALYAYLHPVVGGPDGDGWPFGRPVHVGEVYAVLQRLPDVGLIEDARLYSANPVTGERSKEPVQRLELGRHQLVFSYEHKVMVLP